MKRILSFATFTTLIGGCLELNTSNPNDGQSSSGDGSSSSSASSSGTNGSSSSGSSASSSSTGSSSSSASSASSSSGSPVMHEIIARSNYGTTIQDDAQGVVCGMDVQMLPNGSDGSALECTHVTQMVGTFFQGLTVELKQGTPYAFSFYFRNGTFASPYGKFPSDIGVQMFGPNADGGGQMHTFEPFANGWYRQSYTFTASSTGTYQLGFAHSMNRATGGNYWLYGFQMETGSQVTEYIAP